MELITIIFMAIYHFYIYNRFFSLYNNHKYIFVAAKTVSVQTICMMKLTAKKTESKYVSANNIRPDTRDDGDSSTPGIPFDFISCFKFFYDSLTRA